MSISVADVDSMPPGAELAAVLAGVAPEGVDDDGQLLDMVAAWDRLISWAHANQLAAMAEFARRPWNSGRGDDAVAARARRAKVGEIGREFAHDEVAARLAVSPRAAAGRMWLAMELVSPLTATAAALRAGDIDVQKARVIADGCRNLDPATAAAVEAKVLTRAGEQSSWRLKQSVRRAAIAADPVGARARWQAAAAERGQWMTPLEDGLAEIRAVLPAADALTVHNVLGAAARAAKTAGDQTRTTAQLRADFLLAPFAAALATGEIAALVPLKLAAHRGRRGELNLTVPATVILGISDGPGELAGYGPIIDTIAQQLAQDCTWRRILTDPIDGTVLAVDTHTYRPPTALARYIEIRDQTCRFRGCDRPAVACHLDHTIAHPTGRTCRDNLGPLCEHHHLFKHALDDHIAHLRQPTPGTFTWTMPTGHTYTLGPPAIAPPINEQTRHQQPDDCPF